MKSIGILTTKFMKGVAYVAIGALAYIGADKLFSDNKKKDLEEHIDKTMDMVNGEGAN